MVGVCMSDDHLLMGDIFYSYLALVKMLMVHWNLQKKQQMIVFPNYGQNNLRVFDGLCRFPFIISAN